MFVHEVLFIRNVDVFSQIRTNSTIPGVVVLGSIVIFDLYDTTTTICEGYYAVKYHIKGPPLFL